MQLHNFVDARFDHRVKALSDFKQDQIISLNMLGQLSALMQSTGSETFDDRIPSVTQENNLNFHFSFFETAKNVALGVVAVVVFGALLSCGIRTAVSNVCSNACGYVVYPVAKSPSARQHLPPEKTMPIKRRQSPWKIYMYQRKPCRRTVEQISGSDAT